MEWKNAGVLSVLTYAALAGGCAATSTSDDTTPAEAPTGSAQTTPAAQQEFWTAIHAADYANVDAIIKDLQADFDTTPQDSRRAEFVGLADVWAASESYRNPATAPQVQMTHDASQSLQTAVKLDPTNYFAAAFLGVGMVDEGRATKNDALATQGWNLIEQATADRPTFAGIIKLFGTRTFAASDPRVQEAIEGMWAGFDACIGGKLDRTNPDYTPAPIASAPTTISPRMRSRASSSTWAMRSSRSGRSTLRRSSTRTRRASMSTARGSTRRSSTRVSVPT
jgi:hypothetical protein